MVAETQDGVPLVDLLHHVTVQTVLLRGGTAEERDATTTEDLKTPTSQHPALSRDAASYLNVLDELLCRRVDGSFGVDDVLDGAGPAGGLVQQFGVEAVRVFAAVHRHVPVTCQEGGMERRGGTFRHRNSSNNTKHL